MAEKQRILIVDDDANIAELISLYLMKECYETMIVGDVEEALKRFPDFKPNLVLLDLMLPGMDGYQVCRELRTSSQVPIIMLSAKGEIFDKVLGLELGADDYMIKALGDQVQHNVVTAAHRFQNAGGAAQNQFPCISHPHIGAVREAGQPHQRIEVLRLRVHQHLPGEARVELRNCHSAGRPENFIIFISQHLTGGEN